MLLRPRKISAHYGNFFQYHSWIITWITIISVRSSSAQRDYLLLLPAVFSFFLRTAWGFSHSSQFCRICNPPQRPFPLIIPMLLRTSKNSAHYGNFFQYHSWIITWIMIISVRLFQRAARLFITTSCCFFFLLENRLRFFPQFAVLSDLQSAPATISVDYPHAPTPKENFRALWQFLSRPLLNNYVNYDNFC